MRGSGMLPATGSRLFLLSWLKSGWMMHELNAAASGTLTLKEKSVKIGFVLFDHSYEKWPAINDSTSVWAQSNFTLSGPRYALIKCHFLPFILPDCLPKWMNLFFCIFSHTYLQWENSISAFKKSPSHWGSPVSGPSDLCVRPHTGSGRVSHVMSI